MKYSITSDKIKGIKVLLGWLDKISEYPYSCNVIFNNDTSENLNINYIRLKLKTILYKTEYDVDDGRFLNTIRYCYLRHKYHYADFRNNILYII
jgi:hypothetical protein